MKYWAPINSPGGIDGNDSYINANPPAGIQGSIPTFQSFEQPLRGLQNLILRSNLMPNSAMDDLQIAQAIRSQWMNWAQTFGGTANQWTAVFNPVPGALADIVGMPIRGVAMYRNPGACTLTVNDLGERPVVRTNLAPLTGGEITAGALLELVYDGAQFQVLGIMHGVSQPLTVPLTLYIRTDGNDGNDGTADTPDRAFKTGQAAMNRAFTYGPGQHGVTLKFGDGTYVGNIYTMGWQGPDITIEPTSGGFSTVHLQAPSATAVVCQGINKINLNKVKISSPTAGVGNNGIIASHSMSYITVTDVELGLCGFAQMGVAGTVAVNNFKISGSAGQCMNFSNTGQCTFIAKTCQILNPVNLALFVDATMSGVVSSALCTFVNAGLVTGTRFECRHGGGIDTLGSGPNYFPGNVAGVVHTPTMGWYN